MSTPLCEYCNQPTTDCGPDGYGGTDWLCLNPECEGLLGFARRIVPKQPTRLPAALAVPEVRALVELLREARAKLATYVDADWPEALRENYPPVQAKWRRDMELCWRIDAALRAMEAEGRG